MGGRRKLHNEALHYLHYFPSIIEMMDRACGMNGEEEGHVYVIDWKARGNEIIRKTETYVGG
jgi:hypothetical protein